jgi:hypothetical protein
VTRLGVIARADDGGLGQQTREVVERLDADVALVVLLGTNARGVENLRRFDGRAMHVNPGPRLEDWTIDATLGMCDVLYTIEGPYAPDLFERCCAADVRLVIHANPELWRGWDAHRVYVPTDWRIVQDAEVLPLPVDTSRLLPSKRAEKPTFAHVTGPAMLDRQGTQLLEAALPYVQTPCDLMIRGDGRQECYGVGNVTVFNLPRTRHYWQVIPDGCWALIQPRRYGGLSLPVQEAAARGLPTLCLDRSPEDGFYGPITVRCAAEAAYPYPMAGGQIDVWECDPRALARLIDDFVAGDVGPAASPRQWAREHSWEALMSCYREALRP